MGKLEPQSRILLPDRPAPICMYCGGAIERNRGQGEHIVQKAIGGAKTLKDRVCTRCNNNELSQVDRELCSLSFLSVVASQEIAGHLALVWDVDPASNNLLVEAQPIWDPGFTLKHLIAYPQITFETHGADFRGDADATKGFGRENVESLLKRAALSAFARYERGKRDSIQFEKCESSVLDAGYRLAPRLYAHRTTEQIAQNVDKQKFYLRYATDVDKNVALDALSKLHRQGRCQKYTQYQGSRTATISFFFDVNKTIRGLLKMGLNLVAAACGNTPIGLTTFPEVVGVVRGALPVTSRMVASYGFVRHGLSVTSIAAPNKAHSFLLTYYDGLWHVHSSFFSGRMGAYVNFPGRCNESWATMRIIAPLGSKGWAFIPSKLVQPMQCAIEHSGATIICPSLQIQRVASEIQVTMERRRSAN